MSALLAACSAKVPNLLDTQRPILNIEAPVTAVADAGVNADSAWVNNKTEQPLNLAYSLFWYDKNGVTTFFARTTDLAPPVIATETKTNINAYPP